MTDPTTAAVTSPEDAHLTPPQDVQHASAASAEKPLNIGQFDTKDPNAWFFRAEMMFRIRSIVSEKRKAELVMECLPPGCWNVVAKFFDENTSPTYSQVKEELLEHWDTKPAARAKQFFAYLGSSAGDTNVSTMYHTLDNLTTIPKSTTRQKAQLNIVMEMTLQLYPKQVRAQLPDYSNMELKDFLRHADRILAAYTEPDHLAAATTEPDTEEPEVLAAARHKANTSKQQKTIHQPTHRRRKKNDTCYYHSRFGDKAYRCQPPCTYSKNE